MQKKEILERLKPFRKIIEKRYRHKAKLIPLIKKKTNLSESVIESYFDLCVHLLQKRKKVANTHIPTPFYPLALKTTLRPANEIKTKDPYSPIEYKPEFFLTEKEIVFARELARNDSVIRASKIANLNYGRKKLELLALDPHVKAIISEEKEYMSSNSQIETVHLLADLQEIKDKSMGKIPIVMQTQNGSQNKVYGVDHGMAVKTIELQAKLKGAIQDGGGNVTAQVMEALRVDVEEIFDNMTDEELDLAEKLLTLKEAKEALTDN